MPSYEIDGLVPVVDPSAYVHPSAVLIGDVIIGPGCYVGPGASLRGDFGRIVLQAGSNVQDNCVLHSFPNHELVVGGRSCNGHIGHGAVLHGCTMVRLCLRCRLVGMKVLRRGDGPAIGPPLPGRGGCSAGHGRGLNAFVHASGSP
jgi:phenylacetic acid degradation protein